MVKLEIVGREELHKFMIDLPEKVDKYLSEGNELFMKKVKKSARLRARNGRKYSTGEMAEGILLEKTKTKGKSKQWKIVANAPHSVFQELGFKEHPIHTDMVKNNIQDREGFFKVKKSKPFLVPALDANIQSLNNMLTKGINKALK